MPQVFCRPLSLSLTLSICTAFIKPKDSADVRGAQVPALADVNLRVPERNDGGLPTAAEGKPEAQQAGI